MEHAGASLGDFLGVALGKEVEITGQDKVNKGKKASNGDKEFDKERKELN